MIINVIHNAAKKLLEADYSGDYSAYIYTGMWTTNNPDDLDGTAIKLWRHKTKVFDGTNESSFVRECLISQRNWLSIAPLHGERESTTELSVRYNVIINGASSTSSSHPDPVIYHYDDPSFNVDEFLAIMKEYLDK